jgi:hypothetical protein
MSLKPFLGSFKEEETALKYNDSIIKKNKSSYKNIVTA